MKKRIKKEKSEICFPVLRPKTLVKSADIEGIKIMGKKVIFFSGFSQKISYSKLWSNEESYPYLHTPKFEFEPIELSFTISRTKFIRLMNLYRLETDTLQRKTQMKITLNKPNKKEFENYNVSGFLTEICTSVSGDIKIIFLPDYITVD